VEKVKYVKGPGIIPSALPFPALPTHPSNSIQFFIANETKLVRVNVDVDACNILYQIKMNTVPSFPRRLKSMEDGRGGYEINKWGKLHYHTHTYTYTPHHHNGSNSNNNIKWWWWWLVKEMVILNALLLLAQYNIKYCKEWGVMRCNVWQERKREREKVLRQTLIPCTRLSIVNIVDHLLCSLNATWISPVSLV